MTNPTDWWKNLPASKRILYTVAAGISSGAVIGGTTTERPIVGIVLGGLLGFTTAASGLALYHGYKTSEAVTSLPDKIWPL